MHYYSRTSIIHPQINRLSRLTVSHAEAKSMLSKCFEWFEQQTEADATQLLLLRRIRDMAAKKARNMLKQQKLTDFYNINC